MQENWAQASDVSMISYTWRILVRSFVRSTCKPGRRAGLSPAVTEIARRWGVWKGLIKPTLLPPVEGILLYLRKKRKRWRRSRRKKKDKHIKEQMDSDITLILLFHFWQSNNVTVNYFTNRRGLKLQTGVQRSKSCIYGCTLTVTPDTLVSINHSHVYIQVTPDTLDSVH